MMKFRVTKKNIGFVIFCGVFFLTVFVIYANWIVETKTEAYIYKNTAMIPATKTALVLGASKLLKNGIPNPYFTYRIQAAKELYHSGKIKAFVVSGDNSSENYNEPEDMRQALVEKGVPDSIIYLDYAGLRTLDSVVRMKKIFGQNKFIVVSQQFHNERAIYIGRNLGLEVYGFNAQDLAPGKYSYRTKVREVFARVKVILDLTFGKQPKHLGSEIYIN